MQVALLRAIGSIQCLVRSAGRHQLRGELLTKVGAALQQKLAAAVPPEDLALTGLTLSSDGCDDVCGRPKINVMKNTTHGTEFISCHNTTGQSKTGVFQAGVRGIPVPCLLI